MYGYEIFHEELMQNLIKSVHDGTASHAYIFEGSEGLGILEAARLFAASLTCAQTDIAPCGSCSSCVEAKANTNPDIVYVRPKKDKKSIGADDMRELEEDVAIKPFNSMHKVYIIENGALLTEAAQNTFLKTFEEPPEYAVFIMIIENSTQLLQTILSRFTLVHFPRVSDGAVEQYISGKYPESGEKLPFLVKYCEGIPKAADKILNDETFDDLRNAALEKVFSLLSSDKRAAFTVQKFMEENKERAADIFELWLSFLRDTLLIETGAYDDIINIDKKDVLRRVASEVNPEKIVKMTDKLVTAEKMLARYVNLKAVTMWLVLE
jgi:DNA polymerase-3 subunit delta'